MSIGLATVMIGFGKEGTRDFVDACQVVTESIGKHTGNKLAVFISLPQKFITTFDTKSLPYVGYPHPEKIVSLPESQQILNNWQIILQEISSSLNETAVCIIVNGVLQVALNGTIETPPSLTV